MSIVSERGLFFVLRGHGGDELGRFPVDASELRAALAGKFSIQVSDGAGASVGVEGRAGGLKVRLEAAGHSPKNCRLAALDVEQAFTSLDIGV